ncbi:MAG: hypothetical protein HOV94_34580 [Saccharothrix sp.]|nr:hypothetical protein [Saccharothrix sp.]
MAVHLADWGLTQMDDDKLRRRDAVLIRMARLYREGFRVVLPPVRGAR